MRGWISYSWLSFAYLANTALVDTILAIQIVIPAALFMTTRKLRQLAN